jgi:hypothetical protein
MQENSLEKTGLEYQIIYGEPLDHRGPIGDEDELENPIGEFLAKCVDELSLAKNGGSATYQDPTWDESIGAPPRIELSKSFLELSDKRFERVAEKIRNFFGDHVEEAEEAITLARSLRDATRQEFNAA